ncbi:MULTISPECIES: PP0621 family protein [unclassified Helicobacter]|uniref:PP0621 family protein n=1 Tax=unclassified Helicobacter TaxID=2593540 RepID=UPI000CF06672|nr:MULTISPECIES: PP0621 family protein [unclassified Helicobacter]
MKFLIFVVLIVAVVWYFFRKKEIKKQDDKQTMIECKNCGIYVSLEESIVYQGKNYCSVECMQKGRE